MLVSSRLEARMLSRSIESSLALVLAMLIAGNAPAQRTEYEKLTIDELQEVVGPIALYPDTLLAHVLAASTVWGDLNRVWDYVQFSRGPVDENDPRLIGIEPHVAALLLFPDVIEMMIDYEDWTAELGDAVTFQEPDVLDAIQAFRQRVDEAGNIETNAQIKIVRDVVEERQYISISPARATIIHVPVYQPSVVVARRTTRWPVIMFATGVPVGAWVWGGSRWGWGHVSYSHRGIGDFHSGRWRPPIGRRPRPPSSRTGRPPVRPGTGPPPSDSPAAGRRTTGSGSSRPSAGGQRPGTGRKRPSADRRRPSPGRQRPIAERGKRPTSARPRTTPRPSRGGGAFGGSTGDGSTARNSSQRGVDSRRAAGGG
ncbi:MAG: DUF3300 domain-containing protein [Planctomycetes bacterium]|nr:DUF3300 domain-containing protein [Planctomycetota bacterium]